MRCLHKCIAYSCTVLQSSTSSIGKDDDSFDDDNDTVHFALFVDYNPLLYEKDATNDC